jgi:dipeptidyl aminopeptidase/acylaminoacyl peptidase
MTPLNPLRTSWLTRIIVASAAILAVLPTCQIKTTVATAQGNPQDSGFIPPAVEIQKDDYAKARRHFRTKLLKEGPAPQKQTMPQPPKGVTEIEYPSGKLRLKAWVNRPNDPGKRKLPAVLFLHGGFGFSQEDWDMTLPYREAGFIVLTPMLRGENGQPGIYTLFYDEVEDVLAAADYLSKQSYVDARHIYVAGHSVGGTLALLAAMTSRRFRAASSFSGSPDQVLYCKYGIRPEGIPFDQTNPREFQLRSPLAYATSFKCPARLYYGTQEPHFHLTTQRTAELAKKRNLDVEAIQVEGNHMSHVPASMKQSIDFFREK